MSPRPGITELDVRLPDGRVLHTYDTGPVRAADTGAGAAAGTGGVEHLTVIWHHGSPQTGAPLDPVLMAAAARGIRHVSYGRPSYGGSTPNPGRDVSSAAADVAGVADALGVERFAVMGASGGGPHALAAAALLPERVVGAVCLAGIAPFTEDYDWYAGMTAGGGLRAAGRGRAARERFAATDEFDPESFGAADYTALAGPWASLAADAGRADAAGPAGLIDDDVAFAMPWGFDLADVVLPVLLVQGGRDRVVPPSHANWQLGRLPAAELWLRPRDGHVSVLAATPVALDWLLALRVG